ncbi:60 kDa SS-A/Ro ribonucleoprotein homolog [Rubritalea halochordaticola]|uniref:60 kDa SS-A/Ro ribonucleoprotein homolog n=2 Tax=Rubritalea halochordaticola TaxID=714537 RepID=A0ABP9UZ44_9BACT
MAEEGARASNHHRSEDEETRNKIMANKSLFQSLRGSLLPRTDTVNGAGGVAYKLGDEAALAQYVATGCLNGTFYYSAEDQLKKILELASKVDDLFLAKTAVYARKHAYMRDTPAILCAVLSVRDVELLKEVFPLVIDNGKMLRNFVQIMRSGVVGRKSLGTASKKLVQKWLNTASDDKIMAASVGQSPSLADVIKMVHAKPSDKSREAYLGYLIGRDVEFDILPEKVKAYERWKKFSFRPVPDVPFQMLTAHELSCKQWRGIANNAPWHMTRMNLNTFQRHGVLESKDMVEKIAKRLEDAAEVKRARVFPYQLMAAYMNVNDEIPNRIKDALQNAMEVALENVPEFTGNVVVCPDVSGSMHSSVTGYRKGATSKVRCIDVAALVAAAILKKNPDAIVLPFAGDVCNVKLNPRDSIMTNAKILASQPMGATNCSAPLKWLNKRKSKVDMVVYVSDNESWLDSNRWGYANGYATATMQEWAELKRRNKHAKMACIDITPHDGTQAKSREDVLNIGGFSDHVFTLLSQFSKDELSEGHWIDVINSIEISNK